MNLAKKNIIIPFFKRFYHELGSDRPMGWKDTLVPIELVEAKKQSLENFFVVETVERFED